MNHDSQETYLYLNHYQKNINDTYEMETFIQNSFPDIECIGTNHHSFFFSFFAHICHPLSITALGDMIGGDYLQQGGIRLTAKRMIDRGFAKPCPLNNQDNGTRTAYYMKPIISDILFPRLPDFMKKHERLPKANECVPFLNYALGLSLLQCMLLEEPFVYKKRAPIKTVDQQSNDETQNGSNMPSLLSLAPAFIIDHMEETAVYTDEERPFGPPLSPYVNLRVRYRDDKRTNLYIIQDMGTVSATTILQRLDRYEETPFLDAPNSHLIFSHHTAWNPTCLSFNSSALKRLEKYLEENSCEKMYYFYIYHENEMDSKLKATLRAYLVCCKICVAYNSRHKLKDASALLETDKLTRCFGVKDHTLADLRSYIYSLDIRANEFKQIHYHKHQAKNTYTRLMNIADKAYHCLEKGTSGLACNVMLQGRSYYILPTTLLANHIDPLREKDWNDILESIRPYIGELETEALSRFSPLISLDGQHPLILKNCLHLKDRGIVCVERISSDLGGIVRARWLARLKELGLMQDIHLVCICDTEEEAMAFAKKISFYHNDRIIPKEGIFFSFLLTATIPDHGGLSVTSDLGTGGLLSLNPLPMEKPVPDPYSAFANKSMEELLSMAAAPWNPDDMQESDC